ncbi:hypothetical protein EIP86_003812 [Pleurotus ostreatoroseus]|nr:hypothetical protein EIP86_003812 [Pleurotus ostreatoroseus]
MALSFAQFMRTERFIILIVFTVFSTIVLAMLAVYASTEANTTLVVDDGFEDVQVWPAAVDTFAIFGIFVCVLTKVTLIPVRIINMLRRGAFTSKIWFEISWLGFLLIFWIANAGYSTGVFLNGSSALCSASQKFNGPSNFKLACGVWQAAIAFSFLNFFILAAHVTLLLTLAIMYQMRGQSVWFLSVNDVAAMKVPAPAVDLTPEQVPMKSSMAPTTGYTPTPTDGMQMQPNVPTINVRPATVVYPPQPTPMEMNGGYAIQV